MTLTYKLATQRIQNPQSKHIEVNHGDTQNVFINVDESLIATSPLNSCHAFPQNRIPNTTALTIHG